VKGMLHPERPVIDVGSAEVVVDSENAAATTGAVERRSRKDSALDAGDGGIPVNSTGSGIATRKADDANGDGASTRTDADAPRWNSGQAKRIVQSKKGLPVESLINQASPTADNRLAISADVPGEAGARRKVVVVTLIGALDLLRDLLETDTGIEVAEQIVFFLNHGVQLIPNPEI